MRRVGMLCAALALISWGLAPTAASAANEPDSRAASAAELADRTTGFGAHEFLALPPANFRSPSRNIVCSLSSYHVQCWLMSSSCWNSEVEQYLAGAWSMSATHRPTKNCPGDFQPASFTLAYGKGVRRGDLVCTSRVAGVRCANRKSGHGFFLSRQRQSTF